MPVLDLAVLTLQHWRRKDCLAVSNYRLHPSRKVVFELTHPCLSGLKLKLKLHHTQRRVLSIDFHPSKCQESVSIKPSPFIFSQFKFHCIRIWHQYGLCPTNSAESIAPDALDQLKKGFKKFFLRRKKKSSESEPVADTATETPATNAEAPAAEPAPVAAPAAAPAPAPTPAPEVPAKDDAPTAAPVTTPASEPAPAPAAAPEPTPASGLAPAPAVTPAPEPTPAEKAAPAEPTSEPVTKAPAEEKLAAPGTLQIGNMGILEVNQSNYFYRTHS